MRARSLGALDMFEEMFMRNPLFVAALVAVLAISCWAQNTPVVAVAAEGTPNFVAVDQVLLNINAVAGINYSPATGGGAILAVTYLNGITTTYAVKLSPDDWKKTQAEIIKARGR